MASENLVLKTIDGVNAFFDNFPTNTYYPHAVPNINLNGYGVGADAFNKLKSDFQGIDFSEVAESVELGKEIKKQKKELADLIKQHTSLVEIFGEDGGAGVGTLTNKMVSHLEKEVADLITKRNDLQTEVNTAESKANEKLMEIEKKISDAEEVSSAKIKKAESDASGKVRIIKQFSDFLAETNANMNLYFWVILFLTIGVVATIALSVPGLLKCFDSYDTYITSLGVIAEPLQIINYAFGILIVKLPWALCLSAVFTGFYSLLKNLLLTYEKINQDKRNMSAIYAVSGNIAEALNDYGFSIADHDELIDENGDEVTVLRSTNKQISKKRESLKWNQIINYFEGMQNKKEQVVESEDPNKLKEVSELLGKLIDKVPLPK